MKMIRFLAWLSWVALRVRGRHDRRRYRSRKTSVARGELSTCPRLFLDWRPNRPQPHVRPGGTIRVGIKGDLDMISSGKIDWSQPIADGESLGIGIEQEEDDFRVQVLRS
jgi:hypothetical protein